MNNESLHSELLSKIAAYTEILIKDPRSTIFVSLAETYRKMGMFDDACQIINKGLEQHPEFGPAYIVLGRSRCQLDDFDGSSRAFERALEIDSNSLAAFVGYARVKMLQGKEVDARELLLMARGLSPADPVINKLLLSLPKDDDSEDSVVPGPGAAAALGGTVLASATLADLYLKQGLKEEALKVYRDLSAESPDDLDLRRRIKEIEGNDQGQNEPDVETESAQEVEKEETVEDELDGQRSESEVLLETLTQWLENIQSRREEHV